jgi:hypothetical protein
VRFEQLPGALRDWNSEVFSFKSEPRRSLICWLAAAESCQALGNSKVICGPRSSNIMRQGSSPNCRLKSAIGIGATGKS